MATSSKSLTIEAIHEIGRRLDTLIAQGPPATRQATKAEAAEILRERIKKMREIGYSLREIVAILHDDHRIDLGAAVIGKLARRSGGDAPGKRGRKPKSAQNRAEKNQDNRQKPAAVSPAEHQHERSHDHRDRDSRSAGESRQSPGSLFGNPTLKNDGF